MQTISNEKQDEVNGLAKFLAAMGVRNNTELEDLHTGITPSSKAGDYSDVKVVTPYGEIEWSKLSRISDVEMRSLMLSIERALEVALCTYESLNEEEKISILKNTIHMRSYVSHD